MKLTALVSSVFIPQERANQSDDLGSILEPDPLVFRFETLGWKILGLLLFVVGVAFFIKRVKLYRKNKYRREAVKKMQIIESENASSQSKINHLNILLKQVAIVSFGREQVAALYGDDWFSFLDSKHKNSDFVKYSSFFKNALYSDEQVDQNTIEAISGLTKKWINQHA